MPRDRSATPPLAAGTAPDRDRQFATTLGRGLQVLRCFTAADPMLGNGEIARRAGLPKATVSRLTYTLTGLGYLRHIPQLGKYQLGSGVLSLAYPLLAAMRLRQVARPFMQGLADHVRGTVNLGLRDRLNMVYVESARADETNVLRPDIGSSVPILRSAIGRAWLAACPEEERAAWLNQARVYDEPTWREYRSPTLAGLREYRERGFCVSHGDWRAEVHGVAVAMRRGATGELMVFSCTASAFRLRRGQLESDFGPRLVAMVRTVEAAMGLR